MITDLELERVAAVIERVLRRRDGTATWEQVERLRLQSDLLDRLAAAQRHWGGSIGGRAEMVRDAAERLADELNRAPGATTEHECPCCAERAAAAGRRPGGDDVRAAKTSPPA
ncbi:hypothetical protein A8924_0974 [Saccharopolyspora erythraea NRRL 2338]|uniref:Uncharacterized protein n=2 Tax=Saccharopolyspora erythraea TaxID=1836 RepID=A4F796_SACEN|nr:hypothetical protein [Saccharopolyspora erythraea]EQD86381.1 hypothetical protein N599_09975 [Saccharopolyspora erythraea D]PFG93723.1 hypothetical protein A8924_0974 [Saccharopolyspora erythraea NRRL 2338]QRK90561.1 hypothetical protein JQX30_03420 [Saccharopolyspora erythraea]CAL99920.1 hypothetical protein SACE_0575 [Saccharopolyspora erythraea NRRL 2338]